MLAWMLYVIMVTLLLSVGAFVAERAARLRRGGSRWIWITAIIASLAIPTVIASVSVQLPNVLSPAAAQKAVVLREATTQVLSPVMWISGSASEPAGWRDFDALLKLLWRGASAAMLLALVLSGAYLLARKRRWLRGTVAGRDVYITENIGPAVAGLLRPRIVVPRWVTMAPAPHQASVIAHEQSHLDARDPQLFTFALALVVLMPWNLPLWWQLRRLRYAIEVDCDARVLRGGIDPAHYGETLISVGERQSEYIGAVAAMSESKSFLEERIRIMISKPAKWRRLGIAGLAGLSIALTALAAQVSPPNANAPAAENAAPQAGAPAAKKTSERVAIKLPAATLDRYVGSYKLTDNMYVALRRDGETLKARLTGQPEFELFAESEDHFFWKVVDAQLVFANDGSGNATLHQYGKDMPLTKSSSGEAAQAQATLEARVASQTPMPGSEAALRRSIESTLAGKIDYDNMEPVLADVTRKQEAGIIATMQQFGELKSITFKEVGSQGWDAYDVQFTNVKLTYRLTLAPNGKIAGMMAMGTP